MSRSEQNKTIVAFALLTLMSLSGEAAEIRLRTSVQAESSLVRLGDVADVRDSDPQFAESLRRIELFAAPGREREVRVQEIQQILLLHTVDLARCEFTGSRSVTIISAARNAESARVTSTMAERAQRKVERLLTDHLRAEYNSQADWNVAVSLDPRDVPLVAFGSDEWTVIDGGKTPLDGRQSFLLAATGKQGKQRVSVFAEFSLPDMVVVASQPISAGEVIRAEYLQLVPTEPQRQIRGAAKQVDDLVGKEAVRAIPVGQPIELRNIRQPILVRRGQLVNVVAYSAGIRVRTRATAMDDGGHGSVILVQTIDKKHKFSARVTGYQVVEVYAGAPKVSDTNGNQ